MIQSIRIGLALLILFVASELCRRNYARVGGSVAREDWKQLEGYFFHPWLYPCPNAPDYYNFR